MRQLLCVVYVTDVPAECGVDGYDVVLCDADHHLSDDAVSLCQRD